MSSEVCEPGPKTSDDAVVRRFDVVHSDTPPQPTLLAVLRGCWNDLLFPGEPEPAAPWQWAKIGVLLLLPALLLYPCLNFHLFEPDEGRYAQIPWEMLTNGDWVVPTLQGRPYLDKPPLFYWLVMLSYAVFGVHDWSARVAPALAVHATILVTYLFGRRALGERSAFWGALVLTAAPGFAGMGRLLLLDGLLTFWVIAALATGQIALAGPRLRRGWWLATSVLCGLGVLTKGPVAVVLVLPPLGLNRFCTRRGCWPSARACLAFAGIVLLVVLPWYGAVCWRLPQFARHFFWEHNVLRFVQPFDHERPVWFYVPVLLLGLLPGTLLSLRFRTFLLSPALANERPGTLGFVLLAGGWCVTFFSMAGCKLPTYILPAFPMLSLALGCLLARSGLVGPKRSWIVLGGCFALMAISHHVVVPAAARYRSPTIEDAAVRALCADPNVPIYCFPRNIDSAAFYLGRADLVSYRSKECGLLVEKLRQSPRAVVLFSHRHSLDLLRAQLPPRLKIVQEGPLGLCNFAVLERDP